MANGNAAELLIKIGADPSNAEQSIQSFRASFSEDITGIGSDLSQWSTKGFGDFSRVSGASDGLTAHIRTNLGAVNTLFEQNRQSAMRWKTDFVGSMTEVLNTSQQLSSTLGNGFRVFDLALGSNIATAIIWQQSIGEAFGKAALQAIGAIAQESIVRAIYSTALGFYLLAIQDYDGAAMAFESAAVFAAVGGATALAGKALAGSLQGSTTAAPPSRSAQTSGAAAKASRSSAASAAGGSQQQNVQVIFQGPVYGGQAGLDELVRHISQAVTERDLNLVAYTVVRQPATRA